MRTRAYCILLAMFTMTIVFSGCRRNIAAPSSSNKAVNRHDETQPREEGSRPETSPIDEHRSQLKSRLPTIEEASPGERAETVALLVDLLSHEDVNEDDIELAKYTTDALARAGEVEKIKDISRVAHHLERDETLADQVAWMIGIARRIDLVGNPLVVEGQTVDGEQVSLSDLQGNTVLVEFWATWCGPCIDELQHTLAMYDRYHDKGFDVIGISTDASADQLRHFLFSADLPWKTIHSPHESSGNLSRQYGIITIPCNILIGPDGNVLSTTARGEELERLLVKHLGDSDVKLRVVGPTH